MRPSLKRVLVTGAGGFIGGHTVQEALRRQWRVQALVHRAASPRLENLAALGRIGLSRGDIRDRKGLEKILTALTPLDAIIHCAGKASDIGRESDFREINFEAVQHLANMTLKFNIETIVFISTTDVYGLHDFNGESEDELPYDFKAANPYPKYKIKAECWLRQHLPRERYSIIRPAAVWGENDPTLTKRIRDFLAWSPWIVHFGPWKGRNRWPLAHVSRVAVSACLAAMLPEAKGRAFNVIDQRKITIDEFYQQVAAAYFPHKKFKILRLPLICGQTLGLVNTALSNIFNRPRPLFDPTWYALKTISRNLDFSGARLETLLALDPLPPAVTPRLCAAELSGN